jgi:ribonuclease-3
MDAGWTPAQGLVMRLLGDRIAEAAVGPGGQDYKTRLQEIAARQFADQPAYEVTDQGPDHAKHFFAEVRVDGAVRGRGQGRSKKQAEQAAARDAWQRLRDGGDPLPAPVVPADPTMEAAAGA